MDVAGPLLKAIGTMWPESKIDGTVTHSLSVVLPEKRRAPRRTTKKALTEGISDEHLDSELTSFDGSILRATTPDDVRAELAYLAHSMLTSTEGAINYVEFEATDTETDRKFVVSCSWSEAQTPHQLRLAAEKRADDLQRKLDALQAES